MNRTPRTLLSGLIASLLAGGFGSYAAEPEPGAAEEQVRFDGDTWLEIAESDDLNLHDEDFTIYARIRTDDGGAIFSKARRRGDWSPNSKCFFLQNGHLAYDVGWVGMTATARPVAEEEGWHDVALTWRSEDGRVRFWIDGDWAHIENFEEDEEPSEEDEDEDEEEEEEEEERPGYLRPRREVRGHVVRIGYARPDFPEEVGAFAGDIEVVRFYQRSLSNAELDAVRSGRPPKRGLRGEWKTQSSIDGEVADSAGRGHFASVKRAEPEPVLEIIPKVERKKPEPVELPKDVYTLDEVHPLLKEHCIRCHGKRRSRGELDVESALEQQPLVRNLDLWKNVLHRIEHGEMPPEDEDQPSRIERAMLVRWLDREINEFDYSQIDNPGFEPARRLTHAEYSNTLGDLFGVDVDVEHLFPEDLSGTSGFDNSANTLFIQPLLMERYMSAADLAVARALPSEAKTDVEKRVRKRILIAEPGLGKGAERSDVEAAAEIIDRFLPRAYRRPVDSAEIEEIRALFSKIRTGGDDFDTSIRKTLAAILVSPKFLLRLEDSKDGAEPYAVGEYEMANRLAYFLWASMPDDELFELARARKLRDPEVIEKQVARLLADPRAETLGSIFAAQWLGFGILGTRVRMDPIDNPWCTDTLMASMRHETEMLVASLIHDNAPITRLIDANYTFLNEELAKHYRLDGIEGETMRRVQLEDSRRHGVLGHGSILAITAFPGRTSPVVRGRWILDDLLGTPPPPPPPNADEISEEIRENRRLTQRQKLALHRQNPKCASCHDEMDPLGLSLENFDWFGRWRERSRGRKVDATGQLSDGTEFVGPDGLRRVILEKKRGDLVRQVTRKMLSYALGRQLEYYDEPAVRKIIAALEEDGYRFQTLIREVVMSYPFRYRKNPGAPDSGE